MKLKIALLAAMLAVAGTATAADNGFYAGAGIGYSKMNVDSDKLTNALDSFLGCSDTDICIGKDSADQYSTPYSIFVGYRFWKYMAAEVAYLDMGSSNYKARIDDAFYEEPGVGTVKGSWHAKGWPVSILGIWPINENWELFGRVGVFMGDMKVTAKASLDPTWWECVDSDCYAKGHESDSSTEFFGGVGVDAAFMDNWGARLEWQAIPNVGSDDTGAGNFNNFMFSILYRF